MKIRRADKGDIDRIKVILDRCFDEVMSTHHSQYVLEKFKAHNARESLLSQLDWKIVYVVEDDGEIIATGSLANFGTTEQPKYSLSNLYVLPERHSLGVGGMLVAQLLRDARSTGTTVVHVPSSRNAVGFYEKMGFAVDDEQHDTEDEITWMSMPLVDEV